MTEDISVITNAMWADSNRATQIDNLKIYGVSTINSRGFKGLITDTLYLQAGELKDEAFAESSIKKLTVTVPTVIGQDVFRNANIGRVEIMYYESGDEEVRNGFERLKQELKKAGIDYEIAE